MSYVGIHPAGRRFYIQSKSGKPLAFAVFIRRCHKRWNAETKSYDLTPIDDAKWERAALIEDRPYEGEHHRVNGSYVPHDGPMSPRKMAEEKAVWYREIVSHEAVIVELREASGSRARP